MPTRSGPSHLTIPALKRGIIVYAQKGRLRAQVWPRRRGKPKHPHTLYMNAWFKDTMFKLRYVDGLAMDWAIRLTKQTGLYPRDLLTRAMTKGIFLIPDGQGGYLEPKQQGIYAVAFQGTIIRSPLTTSLVGGTNTIVNWNPPALDTVPLWSPSAPSRITIPKGINIVRVEATYRCLNAGNTSSGAYIRMNGSQYFQGNTDAATPTSGSQVTTGPVLVAQGDYFEFAPFVGANRTLDAQYCWMTCEVLDANIPSV